VLDRHRARLVDLRDQTDHLRFPDNFDAGHFLKLEIALHQLLLQAPDNQLMIERHQFIYAVIEFQLRNAHFTSDRAQLELNQHLQILDAILRQDEASALTTLQAHLEAAENTLLMLK
jgi:DNA-binding FadR family transcriptional regulator